MAGKLAAARAFYESHELAEAQSQAQAALTEARKGGDTETRLAALELLVNCYFYGGDMFAANLAATDELAMIRRSGEQKAEAKALKIKADVDFGRGDYRGAKEAYISAVALNEKFGDKAAQAEGLLQLAQAQLAMERKADALASSEEALRLNEELGDREREEAARHMVSHVHVEMGQLEKAPNRPEALKALEDLTKALEDRDKGLFALAHQDLVKTGASTQKDIDSFVAAALEKEDASGAQAFLMEEGVLAREVSAGRFVKEVPKRITYLSFRMGGMGYGPRFQCLQAHKSTVPGKPESIYAWGCLQISEKADDWETQLQFHPGCLDGALQCGSALAA